MIDEWPVLLYLYSAHFPYYSVLHYFEANSSHFISLVNIQCVLKKVPQNQNYNMLVEF